jgi:predicted nuclease with RNAse H fold
MSGRLERWAGVDVGAAKGFDIAVVDRAGLVAGPERIGAVDEAVAWLRHAGPRVVAVDSPRSPAPDGELSRAGERELVRAGVCGIRYTPDAAALARNTAYYAWIANGLDLYRALDGESRRTGWEVIECFPTATWSRLGGPRGTRSRARWSSRVLGGLRLQGIAGQMSQDARDAVGAAVTARLYDDDQTDAFGEIIVPR